LFKTFIVDFPRYQKYKSMNGHIQLSFGNAFYEKLL